MKKRKERSLADEKRDVFYRPLFYRSFMQMKNVTVFCALSETVIKTAGKKISTHFQASSTKIRPKVQQRVERFLSNNNQCQQYHSHNSIISYSSREVSLILHINYRDVFLNCRSLVLISHNDTKFC